MKDYGLLIAFVPLAVACAGPAEAACAPGTFMYNRNGEDYCSGQSDGSNGGYRLAKTYDVTTAGHGSHGPHTKAGLAAALARRRAHRWY